MHQKKFAFACSSAAFVLLLNPVIAQIDTDASEKTIVLYNNLKHVQNSPSFLFGQEFFNSFRYSSGAAHGDKEFSDSKEVTGAHPALLGSDFHYYLEKGPTERGYHTEAVKWAYQQGYVITFDWHISARGTSSYEYNVSVKDLVNNIVNDLNGDRAWFYGELDKVILIINDDLVVNGTRIPIVLRPLHEMNGGWFWWGSQATTADNYKAFYRLLVNYMKTRTNSVLYSWSPNSPTNMNYYPGDDYVDILGVDIYEVNATSLRTNLAPIVDHAQANNKVAVLSETGNRTNGGATAGDNAVIYWLNTVLPAIVDDPSGKSKKIAWVLTWINASWSYPYVPHANSSAAAKESFINFKNSPFVLFGNKVHPMYTPIPVVTAVKEIPIHSVELFPVPVAGLLNIRLTGFQKPTRISVFDVLGKLVYETETMDEESTLKTDEQLRSGLYVLKVTDSQKSVSKKVVVN